MIKRKWISCILMLSCVLQNIYGGTWVLSAKAEDAGVSEEVYDTVSVATDNDAGRLYAAVQNVREYALDPADDRVWDGVSANVQWYMDAPNKSNYTYELSTAAELFGLSLIAESKNIRQENGRYPLYYDEDGFVIIDTNGDGDIRDEDGYLASRKIEGTKTLNSCTVKLKNDIDLGGHSWHPIGAGGSFQGTFDGQGYTISNFVVEGKDAAYSQSPGRSTYGLFGYVKGGTVKNLTVENAQFFIDSSEGYDEYDNIGVIGASENSIALLHCNIKNVTVTFINCAKKETRIGYAFSVFNSGSSNIKNCSVSGFTVENLPSGAKTDKNSGGWAGLLSGGAAVSVEGCLTVDAEISSQKMQGDFISEMGASVEWYVNGDYRTGYNISDARDLYGLTLLVQAGGRGKSLYYDQNYMLLADTDGDGDITDERGYSEYRIVSGDRMDNRTVYLINDIDLKGCSWLPLGSSGSFRGRFEGQGHTISNYVIEGKDAVHLGSNNHESYYGFFGCIALGAQVRDLTISDAVYKIEPPADKKDRICVSPLGTSSAEAVVVSNCHAYDITIRFAGYGSTETFFGYMLSRNPGNGSLIENCSVYNICIEGADGDDWHDYFALEWVGAPGIGTAEITGCQILEEDPRKENSDGIHNAELQLHAISELNGTEYPIDSAEGEEKNASLEVNYRESYTLNTRNKYSIQAFYPRIKKLPDGSYIMLFHNTKQGGSIYCVRSEDCLEWGDPVVVFQSKYIEIDCDGTCFDDAPTFQLQDTKTDTLKYMDPDACVLSDGRILCVTAFRADKHYRFLQYYDGVAYKISEDGGKTWGEERIVYHGNSWEPSVMEDRDGNIYIFWTCSAPSFYDLTAEESQTYSSSGVAMVCSSDGGKTWTPDVSEAPYKPGYEYYVMRQYVCTEDVNGRDVNIYTDQMPMALQLNNGTVALAAESRLFNQGNTYRFSISYHDDGFAEPVSLNETGPENRQTNLFSAAAPYLLQFDSGEVVLTYHWSNAMCYRIADSTARNFYNEHTLMTGVYQWGSSEKVSSHSAVMSIGTHDYDIKVARVYLNHAIHAGNMSPSLEADISEWDGNTDALFAGSDSQAQVSVRAAYDDENIYLLAERLDDYVTEIDKLNFYLYDGDKGFYKIVMNNEKIAEMSYWPDAGAPQSEPADWEKAGLKYAVYVDGTVNVNEDEDNGVLYKLVIPREMLHADHDIKLLVDLVNCDMPDARAITDGANAEISISDVSSWFTVRVAPSSTPALPTDPETPGETEKPDVPQRPSVSQPQESASEQPEKAVSGTGSEILDGGTWEKLDDGRWKFKKKDNTYAENIWGSAGNVWYYFREDGIMAVGWQYLDNVWYHLDNESGAMETGWYLDEKDGRWYYFDPQSGGMKTGWLQIDGKWYYLSESSGEPTYSYDSEAGEWLYMEHAGRPYGSMYKDEFTPDGFYVNENGERTAE